MITRQTQSEIPLTNKLAAAEDDEETNPDGLSKVDETPEELNYIASTVGFLLQILDSKTGSVWVFTWDGNEEPNNSGNGEEGGAEEEAVVVPELGDGGGGSNSSSGAGDFVEDMLEEDEVSRRAVEHP